MAGSSRNDAVIIDKVDVRSAKIDLGFESIWNFNAGCWCYRIPFNSYC